MFSYNLSPVELEPKVTDKMYQEWVDYALDTRNKKLFQKLTSGMGKAYIAAKLKDARRVVNEVNWKEERESNIGRLQPLQEYLDNMEGDKL